MNRSILIVICDFLLISLLAFSNVDDAKLAEQGGAPNLKMDISAPPPKEPPSRSQDLNTVMKTALNEERKGREQLLSELTKTRDAAMKQEAALTEREKQVQTYQQELQTRQQAEARLQQQQTNLQQEIATAQTSLQSLNQKLQSASTENKQTKESLATTAAEARKQADRSAELQRQLDALTKANQLESAEKQKLATALQVAEVERRHAAEQAQRMENEVKVEREEKAKLADNVKALATHSGELAKEIHENQPLAPNVIFNEFVTNRVQANFEATRSTLLGIDSDRRRDTQTILLGDGTNLFALCHVQDTPLTLWTPGTEWEGLTGSLTRNGASIPIRSLSFYLLDPRIVLMPVTPQEAAQLGGKIYRISKDPFKFQDAIVVGTHEGYYGESKFEVDLTTPKYVRMDRNSLKGLFGKFNPSRGDLVFSRTGDFLGVMANGTYCMLVQNFDLDITIRFGLNIRDQHTGATLSMLNSTVQDKPFKLH